MYASNFDYYRPTTLNEAVELLKSKSGAKVVAGGHSLIPAMKLRAASPAALVDISRIGGLSGISKDGGNLKIGALATHTAVASSELVKAECGLLAETAAHIGDQQVRNKGTIGGSLAHADPAADYPTAIVALGGTMTALGPKGAREIAAENFFTGLLTTALAADEVLTSVSVPAYGKTAGACYLKHRHPASSYAVAGVAAMVMMSGGKCTGARLAVGGVTGNPVRVSAAEEALMGSACDEAACAAAAAKVAAALKDPLSDHYASGEYRVHLATVLAKRALMMSAERAKG
jgi:carbon-monoxide dehydrogenase medium subunit